jgi:hypothetical protein
MEAEFDNNGIVIFSVREVLELLRLPPHLKT